jgi:hypothetical protein
LTTTNKAAPLEVLTASNDPMPAKGLRTTDNARRAKVSTAPDSAMTPTVPVLNDPMLAPHPLLRPHGANERALAKRIQNLSPEQQARVFADIDENKKFANFLKRKAEIAREGRGPQRSRGQLFLRHPDLELSRYFRLS